MSSTQGHTNIHTVHTTVDISVLLGEINRIADGSYSEGFMRGCDVGTKIDRAELIDEIIETLAQSEDTMLSDKQYYTLMESKGE